MDVFLERIRLMRTPDAAGGFARFRVQDHRKDRDGMFVVFALPAHVAYPGREVWSGDKFFAKPCEVRDCVEVHNASGTFIAWFSFGLWVGMAYFHLTVS